MMHLVIFFLVVLFGATEAEHGSSCPPDKFRCFNDNCISSNYECDNDNDCRDNSDEEYCSTDFSVSPCPTATMLKCANQVRCYHSEWTCDGRWDCSDGSDERDCYTTTTTTTAATITTATTTVTGFQTFEKVPQAHRNLTRYFLNKRQPTRSINKWGPHALKTAIALFLADKGFFAPGNSTGEEIAYEIALKLMSKLSLKKKVATQELSFFINALTASCINPYDFFGVDLVAELRNRVKNGNSTNPFTILTLCNADDNMTSEHVVKLRQLFDAHHRPLWTDTQALVTMALACIWSRSNVTVDDRILKEMAVELKRRQFRNGTVDNLRSTALVVQALLATDSYQKEFDLGAALKYMVNEINSKYVSFTDLYYILPIMNTMSLVNITNKHCTTPIKTDLEVLNKLRENVQRRIQIHFSVYIGDDMDFGRTWKLKVPSNYNFYQVLETISTLEPSYKIQYSISEGKPYVNGLRNFFDDAAEGKYWFIYTQTLPSTNSNPKLVEQSPVDIQVKETEELILWYRSRAWDESQTTTEPTIPPF